MHSTRPCYECIRPESTPSDPQVDPPGPVGEDGEEEKDLAPGGDFAQRQEVERTPEKGGETAGQPTAKEAEPGEGLERVAGEGAEGIEGGEGEGRTGQTAARAGPAGEGLEGAGPQQTGEPGSGGGQQQDGEGEGTPTQTKPMHALGVPRLHHRDATIRILTTGHGRSIMPEL